MGIDPHEKTPLVATGPFAYVRHPIYTLSALMMAATVAAVGSPLMIGAGLVHVALLLWESLREEQYLVKTHGERYAHYRANVGRFVPRVAQALQGDGGGDERDRGDDRVASVRGWERGARIIAGATCLRAHRWQGLPAFSGPAVIRITTLLADGAGLANSLCFERMSAPAPDCAVFPGKDL